jgi:hypothetical protein
MQREWRLSVIKWPEALLTLNADEACSWCVVTMNTAKVLTKYAHSFPIFFIESVHQSLSYQNVFIHFKENIRQCCGINFGREVYDPAF